MTIPSIPTLISSRTCANFSENKKEILFKALITTVCIVALGILEPAPISITTGIVIGVLSVLAGFSSISAITKLLQSRPLVAKNFIYRMIIGVKNHLMAHPYAYSAIACAVLAFLGPIEPPLLKDMCIPNGGPLGRVKAKIFDRHRGITWYESRVCIPFLDPPRPPLGALIGPLHIPSSLAQNQKFYDSVALRNGTEILEKFDRQIDWHKQRTCLRFFSPWGEGFDYIDMMKKSCSSELLLISTKKHGIAINSLNK